MEQGKKYWLTTLLTGLAVCCAVKLVVLSGGLGFLAGIFTGQGWWLILGGSVLLLGAAWWWLRRRQPRCGHPCNPEVQNAVPSEDSELARTDKRTT
jgi:LPXTG-motif cell wall-anchored protein